MGGKDRLGGRCAIGANRKHFHERRCRAVLMAALGTVLAAPAAVHATAYSWNINASGLFDTAANWTPSGGPPATNLDAANFDQTGTYTVTFQTNRTNNAFFVSNGNVAFALSGQTYTLTNTSLIGDTAGQTGRLTVSNGILAATTFAVGFNNADTGFLTLTTNSVFNMSGNLFVGSSGTGTLTVQNGADLNLTNTGFFCSIGDQASAFGTVTVNGAGSTWTSNGQLTVGSLGTGSLSINSAGVVTAASASPTQIGNGTGSEGSVTVSGAGSRFSSTGSQITVGNLGKGSLAVTSGGIVTATTIVLGNAASGNGTMTIGGADSSASTPGTVFVGAAGTGTLNVTSGGLLTCAIGTLASSAGSQGTVSIDGAGSAWNISGSLLVGGLGTGSLAISSGGSVTSGQVTTLGNQTGANGTLTVSGAGSTFTAPNITVGTQGTGTLNILDGGTVNTLGTGSTIASSTNGVGTATVSGAGSTWNNAGLLIASTNGGNGSLSVGSGGTVNINGLLFLSDPTGAPSGTLTLNTGGTINVTNGFSRRGTFNFNGGQFNMSGGVFLNALAPAPLVISGLTASDLPVFHLSGTATTSNVSDLTVGATTSGAVEVVGGARLTMSGNASLGLTGGSGSVLVDGAGSNWSAATLQFGVSGGSVGSMTISNGGTVNSAGGVLGLAAGTTGNVSVTGAGSSWTSVTKVTMGSGGAANLTIADGASVSSAIDLGSSSAATLNVRTGGSLTSSALTIGIGGTGTMNVESGGRVNTSSTTFIGNGSANGTATVTGIGSSWAASAIQLASASGGSGTLNVLAGGSVTTNTLTLNDPAGAPIGTLLIDGGNVTVNGVFTKRGTLDFRDGMLTVNGGTFDNAAVASPLVINGFAAGKTAALRLTGGSGFLAVSDLTIGQSHGGSLFIETGSTVVSTGNVVIADKTSATGTMTVDGFFQNTGAFRVGGGVFAGGPGTLLVENFGEVVVNTTLFIYPQGTVRLNNGRLVLGNFTPNGGVLDFISGSVTFSSDFQLEDFHLDGLVGPTRTLRGGQSLFGNNDLTLASNLKVDGGTFEAFNDLIISPSTFLTVSGGTARASNSFTTQPGGVVSIQGGGVLSDFDINNAGEIQLHGGTSLLSAPNNLNNTGLITGSGQISAPLNNLATGVVRVSGTDRLVVIDNSNNNGLISLLNGGTIEFRSAINNQPTGRITGRGTVDARAGMTNNGQIAFSGELSDFFGPITNNSGGKIIVTGLGMATFYDTITHNGGAEIRVSAGSSAVFLGAVNGVGTFSGSGTKYFEGGGSAVGPVITPGSTVVEAAASLSASLIREDSLTVNGQVTINTSGGTSHLNALTISGSTDNWDGVLDLKNNSLVLETGNLALITNQIRSGLYQGTGITSSAPGNPFRLGSMSNAGTVYSSFQGISGLNGDEVLIRYTRIGDLNLDGNVTISDFIDLASHFNQTNATWQMGDVNYDGSVTISDFIDLASNFNQSVSGEAMPISDADAAMLSNFAAANVPEPAWLALILSGALLLRRRIRQMKP